MQLEEILQKLRSLADPKSLSGMARFGINTHKSLGVSMPAVREIAEEIGKDHKLAQELWASGIHEARILAGLIGEPDKTTVQQMESWVKDLDSWDVCDQVCGNLFDRTEFACEKAFAWSERKEEFIKRAGFVLMATMSVHDKKAGDKKFEQFFPVIKKHSTDERNFVRKAVNWALRQIGKRNVNLNKRAVKVAEEIQKIDSKSAKWIANDAIRELTSEAVQRRLTNKR